MESKKALKLIDKIITDLNHAGIIINTLVDDLKELREFARAQQNSPLSVKVLRLTYEHILQEETFLIPIPEDEPIADEDEGVAATDNEHNAVESLVYLISLLKDLENKMNVADLKEYRDALNEF